MIADTICDMLTSVQLPAYTGELPGSPDNAVAVMEYDGAVSTEYFGPQQGSSIFNPIVKVVVRNRSYEQGATWADLVKDTLHRYQDGTLMSVLMVGTPMYLGKGVTYLHEFQVTFKITKKE